MTSCFSSRPACPVCKATNPKRLYACRFTDAPIKDYLLSFYPPQGKIELDYLIDAEFALNECSGCGLVYQEHVPNGFLMQKLYEEWIDPAKALEGERTQDVNDHIAMAREVMTLVTYFKTRPSDLRFLDFGMGWGRWCQVAQAFGCEVYGVELSTARMSYARANGIRVIGWDDIKKMQFDYINTEQVFEHIPEPMETLNYLRGALKPRGLIKVSVPDGRDIKRRLAKGDWMADKDSSDSLNPVAPLEHINCYSRSTLRTMARLAGMQEVKIPLSVQYRFTLFGKNSREIVKNVLRPIYRNVLDRGAYVFLRQSA